jgi:hypothetical protein
MGLCSLLRAGGAREVSFGQVCKTISLLQLAYGQRNREGVHDVEFLFGICFSTTTTISLCILKRGLVFRPSILGDLTTRLQFVQLKVPNGQETC